MNSVLRISACACFVLTLVGQPMARAQDEGHQYVTRMEKRSRLVYEPRVKMVEKTFSRTSWIPFRLPQQTEKKLVPMVTWVPHWTQETVPVTERIAGTRSRENPRRTAPQVATRSSGNLSIGRPPTPTIQTRPIALKETSSFGGVQNFADDVPRVGLKLRDIR